jgi:hypothetical protein
MHNTVMFINDTENTSSDRTNYVLLEAWSDTERERLEIIFIGRAKSS